MSLTPRFAHFEAFNDLLKTGGLNSFAAVGKINAFNALLDRPLTAQRLPVLGS